MFLTLLPSKLVVKKFLVFFVMSLLSINLNSALFSLHRYLTQAKHGFKCDENNNIISSLVPGDGIGPELTDIVRDIFEYSKFPVVFETVCFSELFPEKSWSLDKVTESILKNGICLEGTIGIPNYETGRNHESTLMKLIKRLDCYANVLHFETIPGIKTRHGPIDISVIREHTEGEYAALEHQVVKGVVECLKIITRFKSERIAKFAFEYAKYKQKKHVTVVHKANIMKLGDGLFRKCFRKIAKDYPDIKADDVIVDNCTQQLVMRPNQYEVILTPNLYGNIVDAITAGIVGGPGTVAGSMFGENCALFRSGTRQPFFDGVGKNIANPTGQILASVKLLNYVGLKEQAELLKKAVYKVIADGKIRTFDIGGKNSTSEYVDAIKQNIGC